MKQFNNQFATQKLLQEQQGPFYVVYNKGYGQGKGVANDFKSFPSFEAAQAFADDANNLTGGTFSKFQKYYYVVGSDHEDFEWISQAAHDKAGLDKEIGEEIEETSTTGGDGAYPTIARKKNPGAKPIAAGKAKNYVKDHWGWKEAPSIPNRESDMFDYRKIYEADNADPFVGREITLGKITYKVEKRLENGDYKLKSTEGYPGTTATEDTLKRAKKINENYSRFKKETRTRTNEQQLHVAMRLAEKKIHEANRILEYTAQLRTELNETKVNKNTQKLMEKITRGIAEAYGKMKKMK